MISRDLNRVASLFTVLLAAMGIILSGIPWGIQGIAELLLGLYGWTLLIARPKKETLHLFEGGVALQEDCRGKTLTTLSGRGRCLPFGLTLWHRSGAFDVPRTHFGSTRAFRRVCRGYLHAPDCFPAPSLNLRRCRRPIRYNSDSLILPPNRNALFSDAGRPQRPVSL